MTASISKKEMSDLSGFGRFVVVDDEAPLRFRVFAKGQEPQKENVWDGFVELQRSLAQIQTFLYPRETLTKSLVHKLPTALPGLFKRLTPLLLQAWVLREKKTLIVRRVQFRVFRAILRQASEWLGKEKISIL